MAVLLGGPSMSMPDDSPTYLVLFCSLLVIKMLTGCLMLSAAYTCILRGSRAVEQPADECPWVKFAIRRHLIDNGSAEEWLEVQAYFDSLSAC